jgi:RNA polymerase sigma-70 factor (ECF subfamily)
VRGAAPLADADALEQRRLVDAFLAASRGGDLGALVELLAPDVVFRVRGAGADDEARGADVVARRVLARGSRFAHLGRHALVNGAPGVLVGPVEQPISVVAFAVAGGRITALDVFVRPSIRS